METHSLVWLIVGPSVDMAYNTLCPSFITSTLGCFTLMLDIWGASCPTYDGPPLATDFYGNLLAKLVLLQNQKVEYIHMLLGHYGGCGVIVTICQFDEHTQQ